jgi:hypothetical protein
MIHHTTSDSGNGLDLGARPPMRMKCLLISHGFLGAFQTVTNISSSVRAKKSRGYGGESELHMHSPVDDEGSCECDPGW